MCFFLTATVCRLLYTPDSIAWQQRSLRSCRTIPGFVTRIRSELYREVGDGRGSFCICGILPLRNKVHRRSLVVALCLDNNNFCDGSAARFAAGPGLCTVQPSTANSFNAGSFGQARTPMDSAQATQRAQRLCPEASSVLQTIRPIG